MNTFYNMDNIYNAKVCYDIYSRCCFNIENVI